MRGLFVTATDTGVGKSVLSAALLAAMHAAGRPVAAYKPVLTGGEEPPEGAWPADDELLALAAGMDPESVAPLRFGPAVSPHLAAQLSGATIDPRALLAEAERLAATRGGAIVVEGVGGLLVPLAEDYLVRDLAVALALPVLIAARPGLGTINHTLLTLQAARAAGLEVPAVVLTPWSDEPDELERSNRETIAALGEIQVAGLPHVADADRALLADAAEALPWRSWWDASGT
ncbi:MAG: dethiobiotin synthetase [Solirubrobacteraceae bacterium]|nr:dethiobiotin synthetase [Solirubrobacteraceae bacterium]